MKRDKNADVDRFSHEELALHVEQARLHLRAIHRLLPGLVRFNDKAREYVNTIVDEEHADALAFLNRLIATHPAALEYRGVDPCVWPELDYTPELGDELLAVWRVLHPLAKELADVARDVEDHTAYVGEQVRGGVGICAFDQALDLADRDPTVRAEMGDELYAYLDKRASARQRKRRGG